MYDIAIVWSLDSCQSAVILRDQWGRWWLQTAPWALSLPCMFNSAVWGGCLGCKDYQESCSLVRCFSCVSGNIKEFHHNTVANVMWQELTEFVGPQWLSESGFYGSFIGTGSRELVKEIECQHGKFSFWLLNSSTVLDTPWGIDFYPLHIAKEGRERDSLDQDQGEACLFHSLAVEGLLLHKAR